MPSKVYCEKMQVAADFINLPDLLLVSEYIHICSSQEFIVCGHIFLSGATVLCEPWPA